MTQFEAEGLIAILKRRKGEEITLIEKKWEAERQKLEADRKHTLNRMHEQSKIYQRCLVNAKEEAHKAQNTENFFELKREEKEVSEQLKKHCYDISEMNRYYQNEFKHLRDKRDQELRELNTKYSEERSRIMTQVVKPMKEEQVNYWKQKFYRCAEELKRLKEKYAA